MSIVSHRSYYKNIGIEKFGAILTRFPFGVSFAPSPSNYTFSTIFTAEKDYDWVRIIWINGNTSVTYSINSISVAASSTLSDYINPTDNTGTVNNSLWVPATTNSNGVFGELPSNTGNARNLLVPAATNGLLANTGKDISYGISCTDWINVTSISRGDNTNGLPLLFVRSYSIGPQPCAVANGIMANSTPSGTAWDTYANGRIVRSLFVSNTTGDYATTPNVVSTSNSSTYLSPVGVQFMSRSRGMSVLVIGDENVQGYGTLSGQNDPFSMACANLSSNSFPITCIKQAGIGLGSDAISNMGYTNINNLKPDIVFIKSETPNDFTSGYFSSMTAAFNASIARGFAMADYCTRHFAIPVLMTAVPHGYTGAAETARQTFNTAIRTSGWYYIDFDQLMNNPANSGFLATGYQSSANSLYYNDQASTDMCNRYVIPMLQKIAADRPI